MSRYTVNLGRARSFSRRKRASKAMKILKEQLDNLEGEEVSISTEVNNRIWENGIERPPAKLEVEVIETSSGLRAVLPGQEKETEPEPEPEPEEETEEAEEEEETEEEPEAEDSGDYDDIVSGTVGEAKDAVRELDSPDYEAILKAEKANKDRKTLKEWLESQM